MALVGPITIQGSTSSSSTWIFKTVVTETAIDAAAKTHTVKVENFLGRHRNASNSSDVNWFGGTYTTTFQIGSEKKSLTLYKYAKGISPGTYVSIGSETFTITETSSPYKVTVKGAMSTSSFTPSSASASGEVTLSVLHQAPIVSIDSIVELNSLLVDAGVSGDTFVPGVSKKQFNISAATYDEAQIVRYGVHISTDNYHSTTTPIEIDFKTNDMFWGYDENQNIITRIRFTAKDDVETTGSTQWSSYPVIPYEKPNLIKTSSSVKRNGQTTGKATLSLSGTFYNGQIGSQNNTITLQFKYWALNASEPETYNNIPSDTYNIFGNNITLVNWDVTINDNVVTDLDKSMSYNFKIRAVDAFNNESIITLICAKGEWLRAIFKDRIDFKKITQNNIDIATKNDIQRNIVSAYLGTAWEYDFTAWTSVDAPIDTSIVIGDKLSFSDYYVHIGSGVTKVLVSGSAYFSSDIAGTQLRAWTRLKDADGANVFTIPSYAYAPDVGCNMAISVPPVIMEVSEGQKISLMVQIGKTQTGTVLARATSLYVEVIE